MKVGPYNSEPHSNILLLLAFPGLAVSGIFFLIPLADMVSTLLIDKSLSLVNLWRAPLLAKELECSITLSLSAGAVFFLVMLPAAFMVAKFSERGSFLSMFYVALLLTFPGLLVAYGFILSFGNVEFITQIFSYPGISPEWTVWQVHFPAGLATTYCYYRIARGTFLLLPGINNFGSRLPIAAYSLQTSRSRALRAILLPEMLHAIRIAFFLAAAIAFGTHGTALAHAGSQTPIPALLYSKVFNTGRGFTMAAAISLVLLSVCNLMTSCTKAVPMTREQS